MELMKRALLLTVDSNVGDLRQEVEKMKGMTLSAEPGKKMGPFTEFTLTSHDPALNWEDLTWLKEVAGDVPIYMKGVSSIEVSHLSAQQLACFKEIKRQTVTVPIGGCWWVWPPE
jgi:L-lactate dehydrogenase (cytochrome)